MVRPNDVIIGQLAFGRTLIEKFTADLTDEDYFTIPAAGTNHVAWLLGHTAVGEDWAVQVATGAPSAISESVRGLCARGSECRSNADEYPPRSEIDRLFLDQRARTIDALERFDPRRWDEPTPNDVPQDVFPTLGALWSLTGTHQFWHIGQLTACRAALGKKKAL